MNANRNLATRTWHVLACLLQSQYLILWLCILWFICLIPFAPRFASMENLGNLLAGMLPMLIVATGQTLVMISGGIDLSATSIIALASVLGAKVMSGDAGWLAGHALAIPAGLIIMLAAGGMIGVFNGAAITRLRLPPFMVTLTAMMFVSGFAIWLTQSQNISGLPEAFNRIGGKTEIAAVIALAVVGLAHLLLSRTIYGRWLYAVGQNSKTAFISGVPVRKVVLMSYLASGLCASVASVLYTGRLETGSPVHGQRILLDVIGATVIGGTSLFGGRGKVIWSVFGVLFLTLIDNSLNLMNCTHFVIMMVKGAVILLAATLDAIRIRSATK